jgi:hypothetical protein
MEGPTGVVNILFKIWPWLARFFSRTYRNSRKLVGTWNYECILRTGIFIDEHHDSIERNAHGGECKIVIEKGIIATKVSILGERKWAANIDDQGNRKNYYNLSVGKQWEANTAGFVTDTKLMYKYSIDNSLVGITFLDINYDSNSRKIKPVGEFYYLPDKPNSINKPGNFDATQLSSLFHRILAAKEEPLSTIVLRSTGSVRFYKE